MSEPKDQPNKKKEKAQTVRRVIREEPSGKDYTKAKKETNPYVGPARNIPVPPKRATNQ